MKRRYFIKNVSITGAAAIALPSFARNFSMIAPDGGLPSVHLTQQDFISTFPWGIRGDKVRILQQEVENELLDTETLAAFAYLAGFKGASAQLDDIWKLMLNSQNHDVHVCLADEVGIDWCNQARLQVAEVKQNALKYLSEQAGGGVIAINTLPWARKSDSGKEMIPGFGYAVVTAKEKDKAADERIIPWIGWFETDAYKIRLLDNGCIETQIGGSSKNKATIGYLTLFNEGKTFDSRNDKPKKVQAWLSSDLKTAYAEIEGEINGIPYVHQVVASGSYIDYETTFDYGNGANFGPEPADVEENPHRIHYYQHDRKLCINCDIEDTKTRLLQNSPYLTWPSEKSKSIESLNFLAMESPKGNIAHFNLGQSGYGYNESSSTIQHVMAFSPKKYVYGRGKQLLKGKETYSNRFMPYTGDWRKSKLSLRASEYKRPMLSVKGDERPLQVPVKGSLLQIHSNTTTATALFERGGNIYVRLWEWSGQKDNVTLQFGDDNASLVDCTHSLKEIGKIASTFAMRPWEIKTIRLDGSLKILDDTNSCSKAGSLNSEPEDWSRKNYFVSALPAKAAVTHADGENAPIYFSTGYHDGFVKPLVKHTKTMDIEMQRIRSGKFPNYASTWEIGGSCWVSMETNDPGYNESLKPFLKEGSIEIVGGTWCEPFNLLINGESVMRQFLYGTEAIEKHLDTKVTIYSNQEHGTFAQMPQILSSFGLKAVVNRTQWAPFGIESGIDADVAEWIGVDGSKILLIPRYTSMDYSTLGPNNALELQCGSVTGHNRDWRTEAKFKEMRDSAMAKGIQRPFMTMLEDIWAEEWRSSDAEMDFYASLPYVKFTSIARYLAMFGIKI
jgi:hypothetical protein